MNRDQWVMAVASVVVTAFGLWLAVVLRLPWWSDAILVVGSVVVGTFCTWDLR